MSARPEREAPRTTPSVLTNDALQRAGDPRTTAGELRRLARHRDPRVRDRVAGNPNAERTVLMSLALTRPDLVAANPVLDWWLLEDPNWLSDIDARSRHRLVSSPTLREGTRWWAARFGTEDDALAVLRSAATNADVVRFLIEEGDPAVAALASDHVSLRDDGDPDAARTQVLPEPGELAGDNDEVHDLLALARPAAWALDALDLSSLDVRRSLAAHPGTTRGSLLRLLLDDDDRVTALAAQHPGVDDELRRFVTRVRDLDPSLAADELDDVLDTPLGLRCAATHPNLSAATRDGLVTHETWQVRRAVASNTTLRDDQFDVLAIDDDRDVRAAVAANPVVPALLLRALRHDRDEHVRAAAAPNSGRPVTDADLLDRPSIEDRLRNGQLASVALQPDLSSDAQHALADAADWRVRHLVATNPSTLPTVLRLLALDSDLDVRRGIVHHAETPARALVAMAADPVTEIRLGVATRTSCGAVLRRLRSDPDGEVRARVAANAATPARVVEAMVGDPDDRVRLALARRAWVPSAVLRQLASDLSDDVRVALVSNPAASADVIAMALATPSRSTPAPLPLAGVSGSSDEVMPVAGEADHSSLVATYTALLSDPTSIDETQLDELLASAPWTSAPLVAAPRLSAAMAARFAVSPQWRVREALAKRSDLHVLLGESADAIVRTLVADSDYDTRAAIAANPITPGDCVDALARDTHRTVRLAVARRHDLSPAAADRLSIDDEDEIRAAITALGVRSTFADLIDALRAGHPVESNRFETLFESGWARRMIAAHPSTSPEQLDRLAHDVRWEVREAVAAHPATDAAVLERLGADADRDVRRAVAANPRTPAATVDRLATDDDRTVVRAAVAGPNRSPRERAAATRRVITAALRSPSSATRVLALSCAEVDERALRRRRHWDSADWCERLAVALNGRTPASILRILADDGLLRVRSAAARTAAPSATGAPRG